MTETVSRDYSETLNLPKTDFPMRAGLPKNEPKILKRWEDQDLYRVMRQQAAGKPKFILHDGPPYANGNIHIGHALNKVLKDIVTRAMQMQGYDSNYVPGWDCHGLPIEWKIEEQYRKKGKNKDAIPVNEFRKECRDFAAKWIDVQRDEFKRLGIEGDWDNPYLTMNFDSEAIIAEELMKFAMSGQLYRGSKPVMWSVVEKTALAEAEVEYQDHESHTIWVKFPVLTGDDSLVGKNVVIWTTTPWTIPANRAVSFSHSISYGLYKVTEAPQDNWAKVGEELVLADNLAADVFKAARVEAFERVADVDPSKIEFCGHPFRGAEGADGYFDFYVPMLAGDHVTDDAGTGFVHTAPGHGADDFQMFLENRATFAKAGTEQVPLTVQEDGSYYPHVPLFEGHYILNRKGGEGTTNKAVIDKLLEVGALIARGKVKHSYPHSWRSKAPLIFRNTPQWFVYMDKELEGEGDTLRARALKAIAETRFVPVSGQHRIHNMIESRPDWVLSRQRAWGVPITIFVNKATGEILQDETVNARISAAFREEGADAWFAEDAKERFLGNDYSSDDFEKVDDILDVWFDSGSTHAFCMEPREDLNPNRKGLGGEDYVLYLEGTDQHRGWFHSSLLESCGTRGHAPYDAVLTHGFTMDEHGRKMSKSLGNTVAPQDVIKQYGADILRLWVGSVDYAEDQRIGPSIIKTNVDSYRKLRNTLRFMLGSLAHYKGDEVAVADMPELEQLMLHRLAELDKLVRDSYHAFDFKRVFSVLFNFMTVELSAFYFDVRKDALYCDPLSSVKRKASLYVIEQLFRHLVTWMAPILPFTTEECWTHRYGEDVGSIHLEQFPQVPAEWRNDTLAAKWVKVRKVRRVITGALEVERREKRIGASLEAHPVVHVTDPELLAALEGLDMAEISITSQLTLSSEPTSAEAFRLEDVADVAVVPGLAEGKKCARCWKILPEVGTDADYPELTLRDAQAMRELEGAA
ncbi:isoleucine--tRNA ligase [Pseudovibrio exalbescens]|uniref:Isoleucine--tRNA ligase n=1 Tax=Pseudovibrio exalbescens TaxID=197461 RepID=A0A1U7JCU6_9HYPH|nr:isoleucine--tRNA ligase [Pseudovibrio exalbescens]OKL42461.1 isoleucine--tRNA ligase [Pseudovibrio exalbescens]